MALLEWREEHSVGIHEFDEQHKKMFDLINSLFTLMQLGQHTETTNELLSELNAYATYHLETEERFFEQYGYPKKEEHTRIHDGYRNKIKELTEGKEGTELSFEILDFLEDWWVEHITGVDKQYTGFFHEKGLR